MCPWHVLTSVFFLQNIFQYNAIRNQMVNIMLIKCPFSYNIWCLVQNNILHFVTPLYKTTFPKLQTQMPICNDRFWILVPSRHSFLWIDITCTHTNKQSCNFKFPDVYDKNENLQVKTRDYTSYETYFQMSSQNGFSFTT